MQLNTKTKGRLNILQKKMTATKKIIYNVLYPPQDSICSLWLGEGLGERERERDRDRKVVPESD